MSHSAIAGKRTRSQLTIPDDILKLPQRSPMKDARSALKNQSMRLDASSSNGTESEDELLLSPDKDRVQDDMTGGPRGSGEPSDQYTLGLPSPSQARASKRRKRDLQQSTDDSGPATEFGALASPPLTQDSRLSPGGRPPHERSPHKPTRSVSPPPSPAFLFPKDRARSVPPFMNTQIIPHIDLRDAPPSPTRSRSRSPSKERLRFVPGPFPSSTLDRKGKSTERMNVDKPLFPVPNHSTAPSTSSDDIPDIPPTPTTNRSSETIVPFTPATSSSLDKVMPMSPLTPVPPTPMPTKSSIQSRIDDQASWKMGMPTLHEDESLSESPEIPAPSTSTTTELSEKPVPTPSLPSVPPAPSLTSKPTLQPRLGSNMGLHPEKKTLTKSSTVAPVPPKPASQQGRTTQSSMPPPTTIPSKPIPGQAKLKGYQQSTIASSAGAASSSSQPVQKKNVFEAMMGKTRAPNSSVKAKEIGTARVPTANKARQKMKPKAAKQNTTPQVLFVPEEHDETEKKDRKSERFGSFFQKTEGKGKEKAEDQDQMEDKLVEEPVEGQESAAQPTTHAPTEDVMMDESPDNVVPPPIAPPADDSLETIIPDTSAEEPPPSSSPPEPEQDGNLLSSPLTGQEIPPPQPAEPDSPPNDSAGPVPEDDRMETDDPAPVAGPSTSVEEKSDQPLDSQQPTTTLGKKLDRKPSLNSVKRVPSTGTLGRVTRSTSSRGAKEGVSQVTAPTAASRRRAASTSVAANKKPAAESSTNALKRTASGATKKGHQGSAVDGGEPSKQKPAATSTMKPTPVTSKPTPVSPVKPTTSKPSAFPSSPIKPVVKSSVEAGPSKTPAKSKIPIKQHSTPSPTKITRTVPVISRPVLGLGRTFAVESLSTVSQPSSALSTLSSALDKLRMPPPAVRPNTSMGFNHGTSEDEEGQSGTTKDDSAIGKASSSKTSSGITPSASQRSVTLGSSSFKGPQQPADSTKKPLKQGTLSFGKPASSGGATAPTALGGPSKTGPFNRGPFTKGKPIFSGVMIGAGPRRTVSKKSSLPVVIGSPVKGGGAGDGDVTMREQDEDDDMEIVKDSIPDEDIFMAPAVPASTSTSALTTATAEPGTDLVVPLSDGSSSGSKDKGKGKERAESSGSRRVSMLSQSLSQSIFLSKAADHHPPADPPSTKGDMGPPPTPPSKRGNSSSPSAASSTRGGSSSPSGRAGPTHGVRSSSRLATKAATEPPATTSRAASSTKKEKGKEKEKDGEKDPLATILKDCKIFVDVRTDEGEDAGTLFSQMLETLGARLLTRVGSTCTHIVFKDGLSSTISRYRAMDDPKPHVVGIGWVVDCVEQKRRSDEGPFAVDLTRINVAGVHKRRRSVLPRLAAELTSSTFDATADEPADGNGDISMDGSQSSLALDDDLPPLERARRRRMAAGA